MKSRTANGVLLILSLAVPLIVAELALRWSGFRFQLYPTKVQFGWPTPLDLQSDYQIDRELLWVSRQYPSKVTAWKGKRPSVVFMGDSCTEFGSYDKSFKSIVQERNGISEFIFVNVGTGGYSSYQGLRQLKRDILLMQPRAVTIYYGWNDHWASFGIEDKDIGQFNLEHPVLLLEISAGSRVVQLINRAIFNLKVPESERNRRRPERVSLSDFSSNLLEMVNLARENGITPVLLTAPAFHKQGKEPAYLADRWLNDLSELVPLHQRYVNAVRDLASREHVILLDLYAEFERLPESEQSKLLLTDGIHLTEAGSKKTAELLYETFTQHHLLDRPGGEEGQALPAGSPPAPPTESP